MPGLQRTYPKLQDWKGRVGESAQTLADVLEFEKSLDLKIERVYHYASLQLAEDSTNNEYLARIGQVQNLLTKIGETRRFLSPKFWRSTTKRLPNSLPIPRSPSGELSCARFVG